jgi:hypothetical protein
LNFIVCATLFPTGAYFTIPLQVFFAAKWNYIAVLDPCANSFVTFLSNRVEMKFSSQHFLPIFNISFILSACPPAINIFIKLFFPNTYIYGRAVDPI